MTSKGDDRRPIVNDQEIESFPPNDSNRFGESIENYEEPPETIVVDK